MLHACKFYFILFALKLLFSLPDVCLTHVWWKQVIKAKKRRLGRAQKTIGDYCLLAGSPVDANAHYNTGLELARLTGDYFWYAGALEGSVCALLVSCDCILCKSLLYYIFG